MYIERAITAQVLEASRQFPAVVLTGARQAGKTTLLREIFPDYSYVSLDLPSEAETAERDPNLFLSRHRPPLIVDEVQYAPGLFRHLKTAIDQERHSMGKYILTGSQYFLLMKNVSDSLAGRAAILELENLSLDEILSRKPDAGEIDAIPRLLYRGQFPELWRNETVSTELFYSSYLSTYLERDVRQILNVSSLRDFERFIRILAARSGSILNKTDIAKDVGVSVKATGDWISVLEASGQIILMEPWFENFGKRIVRSPKIYFRDTGLLCYLLGLNEETILRSPFLGPVWETFLFAELRKSRPYREKSLRVWFYRDQRAREIDFVLEYQGRLSFAEAKWTELPDSSDVKTLKTIKTELEQSRSPWRPGETFVFCRCSRSFPLPDGSRAVSPGEVGKVFE